MDSDLLRNLAESVDEVAFVDRQRDGPFILQLADSITPSRVVGSVRGTHGAALLDVQIYTRADGGILKIERAGASKASDGGIQSIRL